MPARIRGQPDRRNRSLWLYILYSFSPIKILIAHRKHDETRGSVTLHLIFEASINVKTLMIRPLFLSPSRQDRHRNGRVPHDSSSNKDRPSANNRKRSIKIPWRAFQTNIKTTLHHDRIQKKLSHKPRRIIELWIKIDRRNLSKKKDSSLYFNAAKNQRNAVVVIAKTTTKRHKQTQSVAIFKKKEKKKREKPQRGLRSRRDVLRKHNECLRISWNARLHSDSYGGSQAAITTN